MRDFNRGGRRDDRRGGGGGFRGGRDSGRSFGGDRGRPSMHKAVCDACKADCEVPFRPTGDKPIFCSDCFEKQGGRDRDRGNRFGGGRDRAPRFESKGADNSKEILKGIKTLNYKLDELIKALGATTPTEKTKSPKAAEKDIIDEMKPVKKAAAKKPAAKKTVKKAAAKKTTKKK